MVWLLVQFMLGTQAAGDATLSGWQLQRQSGEVKIYTREMRGSELKAVRIETRLSAPMERVVALLTDPVRRPEWDEMCESVTVLAESESSTTAYFHYDMPWPVADRDLILKTDIQRDDGAVLIKSVAVASDYPLYEGRVRVSEAWYHWRLRPGVGDVTEVVAEMYMDPAGPIPAWLLNRLALSQPPETLERLNRVLQAEEPISND